MSPTIEPKPHIAVLEDHEDTREMLRVGLESHFSIREFSNAPDLLTALEREKFSAILADIMACRQSTRGNCTALKILEQ